MKNGLIQDLTSVSPLTISNDGKSILPLAPPRYSYSLYVYVSNKISVHR